MWNTTRHLEAWYGISGMGGVCHTLNPRLFADDIIFLVGQRFAVLSKQCQKGNAFKRSSIRAVNHRCIRP